MLFLLFVSKFYLACQIKLDLNAQDTADCWRKSATQAVEGTLNLDDSCQVWEMDIGAHAYINVHVSSENTDCDPELAGHLSIPYDPTYSNMGEEGPKWTFDILGEAQGEGAVRIACQDGTVWEGYFIVTETSP